VTYYCSLCGCQFDSKLIVTHAKGQGHRQQYEVCLPVCNDDWQVLGLGILRLFNSYPHGYHLPSTSWHRTSVLIGLAAVHCQSSNETPWSPPLIDFQSSRRPPVAMCYCRRSVICYCRPSTLEQSTC